MMGAPLIERLVVVVAVIFAIAVACFGVKLSLMTHDPHWLNRAGSLIVCVETVIVFLEFYRRKRIEQIERVANHNPYLKIEAMRAERQLVFLAICFVVFGEFLHGFGDLLVECFMKM